MSHPSSNRGRGFSLPELLVAIVILGVLSGMIALMFGPIISAPQKHQAKVDTVQAAARAMYRMQRDIRMSSKTGIFICQNDATNPNRSSATSTLTSAPLLALLTPRANGHAPEQYVTGGSGNPRWTGFQVYWLDDSNNLLYAFGPSSSVNSGQDNGETPGTANAAVKLALAASNPEIVSQNISDVQTFLNTAGGSTIRIIGLKLTSMATDNGRTNESSLESDTVARN